MSITVCFTGQLPKVTPTLPVLPILPVPPREACLNCQLDIPFGILPLDLAPDFGETRLSS